MPGRKYTQPNSSYRYGFNGKENDNEVKGEGNQQDYGMRIYDPRLVRFLSVDPITKSYPELTPYQFASNTPIQAIDLDGLEAIAYVEALALYSNGDVHIKVPNITITFQVLNLSSIHNNDLRIDEISRKSASILRSNLMGSNSASRNTLFTAEKGKVKQTNNWKNIQVTYDVANVDVRYENISSRNQIRDNTPVLTIVDGYSPEGKFLGLQIGMAATVQAGSVSKTSDAVSSGLLAAHEISHTLGAEDNHGCNNCLMASDNPNSTMSGWNSSMKSSEVVNMLEGIIGSWERTWQTVSEAKKGSPAKIQNIKGNADKSIHESDNKGQIKIK